MEEPVLDQRHAVQADGQPQPQGRRRHAADRRGDGDRDTRWAEDSTSTASSRATAASAATSWRASCSASPPRGRSHSTTAPFEWFTKYYGAYVQDDWRVSERLTVNYGLRFEHEDGLQGDREPPDGRLRPERDQSARRACAEDRAARGSDDQGRPDLRRRGRRAGRRREIRPRSRSRPASASPMRRARTRSFAAATDCSTRRGTTPGRSARTGRLLPDDVDDSVRRHHRCADRVARKSVPGWPASSRLAARWGCSPAPAARSTSSTRTKGTPRFTSTPSTSSASCRGPWRSRSATSARPDATSATSAPPAAIDRSDQHQPDRPGGRARGVSGAERHLERGGAARLGAQPVLRRSGRGRIRARAPTIQAGQLLRPFPQFGDVFQYEKTDGGRRQYHAATFVLDKRTTGWWGGRFSYTLSQTKDNQFGQDSTYQTRTRDSPEQLRPGCRIRHQQLRLAAPDHPGADLQVSRLEQQQWRCAEAPQRVERIRRRRARQRVAAQRRAQHRACPTRTWGSSVAGSGPTSQAIRTRREATTIAWPRPTTPTPLYFNSGSLREPGGGAVRHGPANQRRRAVSVPEEHRPRARERHDVLPARTRGKSASRSSTSRTRRSSEAIDSNAIDSTSFGRITQQAGFMRIWQLTFRYRF